MYDKNLAREILSQMLDAISRIQRRFSGIANPDDFITSDEGLDQLDAIGMMLIALGESCKNLDKVTGGELLNRYPEIDWKGVKGIRDILSHHYFDLNNEVIFSVCKKHIPTLHSTVKVILKELEQ